MSKKAKYEAVMFEGESQVILRDKEGLKHICKIPNYYQEDLGIANAIAKLLNTGTIKLDLTI